MMSPAAEPTAAEEDNFFMGSEAPPQLLLAVNGLAADQFEDRGLTLGLHTYAPPRIIIHAGDVEKPLLLITCLIPPARMCINILFQGRTAS